MKFLCGWWEGSDWKEEIVEPKDGKLTIKTINLEKAKESQKEILVMLLKETTHD